MRVLLLSAYDAPSHKRWRDGLVSSFPEFTWTSLALPARYFSWRIRGNSLSFAYQHRETLTSDYDLFIVTSMVDLSALRGFVPAVAKIPTIVYFHENQFSYPESTQQKSSVEPKILNIYTALCGDILIFNSSFNRNTFLQGAKRLLKKLPDCVPKGLTETLQEKSWVLPVPLENFLFEASLEEKSVKRKSQKLQIVWNHRWEYDKNPGLLLKTLQQLATAFNNVLPFDLHVVGQKFREQPSEFAAIETLLEQCSAKGQWGFVATESDYYALLSECHIVLSTAWHDFQGLSVLEAVALGCLPVVPNRQAYPEWFSPKWCYEALPAVEQDISTDVSALVRQLHHLITLFTAGELPAAPDVSALSWAANLPAYRDLLTENGLK